MRARTFNALYELKKQVWLVPMAMALGGLLLSGVTMAIDRSHPGQVRHLFSCSAKHRSPSHFSELIKGLLNLPLLSSRVYAIQIA